MLVYKSVFQMTHELAIAFIFSNNNWFFHLKSFQYGATHSLAFAGIDDSETVMKIDFIQLFWYDSDILDSPKLFCARFIVLVVNYGTCNVYIHIVLVY